MVAVVTDVLGSEEPLLAVRAILDIVNRLLWYAMVRTARLILVA